jgi:hypothetical protein
MPADHSYDPGEILYCLNSKETVCVANNLLTIFCCILGFDIAEFYNQEEDFGQPSVGCSYLVAAMAFQCIYGVVYPIGKIVDGYTLLEIRATSLLKLFLGRFSLLLVIQG